MHAHIRECIDPIYIYIYIYIYNLFCNISSKSPEYNDTGFIVRQNLGADSLFTNLK